jgi:branched-chain amino acid transport system permease protein
MVHNMRFLSKPKLYWFALPLAILLILPFFAGEGWTSLIIEIFVMCVAASAANLMTGYAGMVSFGVAGFYGLGAYVTALLITEASLPFGLAFLAGPVGAALLALPVGWFCVRRTAIYFAMLTLAFAQLLYVIAYTWYSFTGGDDGIVGIEIPSYLSQISVYYYFALAVMIACLLLMWTIVNSPFGKTIQALRENPERTAFIGVNVRRYQHAVFIISSFFLAVAGSLYCGLNQNVFADYLFWTKTFDIVIVYLLGGIYNFLGPAVGATIYIIAGKVITRYTEYWPLTLGLIIVVITIFMPRGVVGYLSSRLSVFMSHKESQGDVGS